MIPSAKKFLFIIFILAFSAYCLPVYSQPSCPYGRINDPYPGLCSLYIDLNNNQICDRSENVLPAQAEGSSNSSPGLGQPVLFPALSAVVLGAYFLTKRVLEPANFRFLWNLLLLAAFLPVGISGVLIFLNVEVVNFQFWHNQLGVVMVLIGLLHLGERLNYFKQVLKHKVKSD